jgi:hypothetical protein
MNPAAPIAQAVAEGFKLLKTVMDTAQSRKMRKAIEAGEKYIQVNEKEGEFNYDMEEKKRKDRLRHYKKRFFKYN